MNDFADIAVEDFFFVVIASLDDFIAGSKFDAGAGDGRGVGEFGIEGVLEDRVELPGAQGVAIHGAEHLDIGGVRGAEFARDAMDEEFDDGFLDRFGVG